MLSGAQGIQLLQQLLYTTGQYDPSWPLDLAISHPRPGAPAGARRSRRGPPAGTPETRAALLWLSSAALAVLVGLAEVYVGIAVVSRRHAGLASLWVAITVLLNALIVPLSVSGLEAVPVWEILGLPRPPGRLGSGTRAVCRRSAYAGVCGPMSSARAPGLPEAYEAHLLSRIAEEETRRAALEAELAACARRRSAQSATSAAGDAADSTPPASICGYWHADQRKVAGHITQCRRKAARAERLAASEERSERRAAGVDRGCDLKQGGSARSSWRAGVARVSGLLGVGLAACRLCSSRSCCRVFLAINLTPSLPRGLYRVTSLKVRPGALVTFCLPPELVRRHDLAKWIAPGRCPGGKGSALQADRLEGPGRRSAEERSGGAEGASLRSWRISKSQDSCVFGPVPVAWLARRRRAGLDVSDAGGGSISSAEGGGEAAASPHSIWPCSSRGAVLAGCAGAGWWFGRAFGHPPELGALRVLVEPAALGGAREHGRFSAWAWASSGRRDERRSWPSLWLGLVDLGGGRLPSIRRSSGSWPFASWLELGVPTAGRFVRRSSGDGGVRVAYLRVRFLVPAGGLEAAAGTGRRLRLREVCPSGRGAQARGSRARREAGRRDRSGRRRRAGTFDTEETRTSWPSRRRAAGKTTCVVVPTALAHPGPLVVLDAKREIYKLTSGFRRRAHDSRVLCWAPSGGEGFRRHNPMLEIRDHPYDVRDAQRIAGALIASVPTNADPFWREAPRQILVGALLHGKYCPQWGSLPKIYQLFTIGGQKAIEEMARAPHDPELAVRMGGSEADGRRRPIRRSRRRRKTCWRCRRKRGRACWRPSPRRFRSTPIRCWPRACRPRTSACGR